MKEIPKRIIQTGKSRKLPLVNQAAVCNLKLLNPDFEYCFFDDDQVTTFFKTEFPKYESVYNAFPFPIQRYDFFRYLAVYRYGGFYFDLDVFLVSDLSALLSASCVFPFEGLTYSRLLRDEYGVDWQIGNYAFGAAPGDRFLEAVIENCLRSQRDSTWVRPALRGMPPLLKSEFLILHTTGPGLITRTLAENLDAAAHVKVLFPPDVCDFRNWNQFGSLGIHLMNGSWRKGGFLWRRLAQYFEGRTFRASIKESERLGKTRQWPLKLN